MDSRPGSGLVTTHAIRTEGDHPGRGVGDAALPGHAVGVEAAAPHLRQADDLLPDVGPHAGRHPRDPGHLHAPGHPALPAAARRRKRLGHAHRVHGAAQPGRPGPGLPPGSRLRARRPVRARARRQHLLRPRLQSPAPERRRAARGGHGLRLRRHRSRALRRGRVRRPEARGEPRGEAGQAQVALRRHRPLLLRRAGGRLRTEREAVGARRAGDHRSQPHLPRRRHARGRDHGARLRLARHRNPRVAARGRPVHLHHREAAGVEGGLPGGSRLAPGLDRRRPAGRTCAKALGKSSYGAYLRGLLEQRVF